MSKKSLWLALVMIVLLSILWAGCGGSGGYDANTNPPDSAAEPTPSPSAGPDPTPTATPRPVTAQWDFLVYMDGDNNLEGEAIADFNEMERIGSNSDVNVLVLLDRSPDYDTSNGNWQDTRLYRVTKDNADSPSLVSEWLQDYGKAELNMADPNTLRNFIVYCQQHYPAEHTLLTLWNHGGGVRPRAIGAKDKFQRSLALQSAFRQTPLAKGICWDDTTGTDLWSCLTTDKVAEALAGARNITGKKIDILNLDACLMQLLEQAYEWRNEADYMVGSAEDVPSTGNAYDAVLRHLTANPNMSAASLAVTLVEDYYDNYRTQKPVPNTTYSALNLRALPAMMPLFANFAAALKRSTDLTGIYRAAFETDYYDYPENSDLDGFAYFLAKYTTDQSLKSAAGALQTGISGAVLAHRETGIHVGAAHGLAILLPTSDEWSNYSAANQYALLRLAQDTEWDDFIRNYAAYTAQAIGKEDHMTVQITWDSGDCDLEMIESHGPHYIEFYNVVSGTTPNGYFSPDARNGGMESYTLKPTHAIGYYLPGFRRFSSSGTVTVAITVNGINNRYAIDIPKDGQLHVLPDLDRFWIKNLHPNLQLLTVGSGATRKQVTP